MKTVYVATNSLDAHVVRGLLESRGIEAIVLGDYLQGGIGELPAFGVVEVRIPETEYDAARAVVAEYETGTEPDGHLEA